MPKTILTVEDNEDVIRILQDRFELWGYHPVIAHSPEEGLKELEHHRVVGAIFELKVPVGECLIALSKFYQHHPQIPIIVTSEETERASLTDALEQGASDYIIKPIDFDLLQGKCARLFE